MKRLKIVLSIISTLLFVLPVSADVVKVTQKSSSMSSPIDDEEEEHVPGCSG